MTGTSIRITASGGVRERVVLADDALVEVRVGSTADAATARGFTASGNMFGLSEPKTVTAAEAARLHAEAGADEEVLIDYRFTAADVARTVAAAAEKSKEQAEAAAVGLLRNGAQATALAQPVELEVLFAPIIGDQDDASVADGRVTVEMTARVIAAWIVYGSMKEGARP